MMSGGDERRLASGELQGREARHPRGGSDVWQIQDLGRGVFGSVAMVGLTGAFLDVWQGKDLGERGQWRRGVGGWGTLERG